MKSKMLIATLLGCLVWQHGALSQTDTNAANPAATNEVAPANQPAITIDTNPPAAPAVTANESPSVTATNEPADTGAANPPAAPAVSTNESPSLTVTNDTGTSATNSPAAPTASTNEFPSVTATNETAGDVGTLVSWQLRFNFPYTPPTITTLTNTQVLTNNLIPPNGIAYYLIIVPTNADISTNILFNTTGPALVRVTYRKSAIGYAHDQKATVAASSATQTRPSLSIENSRE